MIILIVFLAVPPFFIASSGQVTFEKARNGYFEASRINGDEHATAIKILNEEVKYLKNEVKMNCNKILEKEKQINQLKRKSASYKDSLEVHNATSTMMFSEKVVEKSNHFEKENRKFVAPEAGFVTLCLMAIA